MPARCSDASCDRDAKARGLCFRHYQRVSRGGPRGTGERGWRTTNRCRWCGDRIDHRRADARVCSTNCSSLWRQDSDRPAAYARTKAWRQRHPDWATASTMRRMRRARGTSHGCLTGDSFGAVRLASDGLCVYCGATGEHFDHFVPLALGGANCIANLVYACAPCNLSKGARPLAAWRPTLAGRVSPPLGCPQEHQEAA